MAWGVRSVKSCAHMWTVFNLLSQRTRQIASYHLHLHCTTARYTLNIKCCSCCCYLHVPPLICSQLGVDSAHQFHCNWCPVSWLHLLLIHYKQDQAATGTLLGVNGKWNQQNPSCIYGVEGGGWPFDDTSTDWSAYNQRSDNYSFGHRLPLRWRVWFSHPSGPASYWCFSSVGIIKLQKCTRILFICKPLRACVKLPLQCTAKKTQKKTTLQWFLETFFLVWRSKNAALWSTVEVIQFL